MAVTITLDFNLHGTIEQQLELADDCQYTPEEVIDMLNCGEAFTGLQEGGDLVLFKHGGFQKIGVIVKSSSDSEYYDFELQDSWDNCE